jgi:hypothetical protein
MEHINNLKMTKKKDAMDETKLIRNQILKKIYKNYMTIPHLPTSEEEANDNITDLVTIQEIIHRIIVRRNNSFI